MAERLDVNLGQTPQLLPHVPCAEHDRDPLCREAASREPEDLCRRAIEPLGVIDHAEEAALPCRLRKETENRERHEERVRSWACAEPDGDVERVALRARETLTQSQDRRAQLLYCGERELHLTFDAGGSDDSHGRGPLDRVVEERCLADSRVAMDDERAAASVTSGLHQPVKGRPLAFPTQQPHPGVTSLPLDEEPSSSPSMPLG